MSKYLTENWDGWPLHSLIAGLLMWPAISNSYPLVMLGINIVFWPLREAWQHDGLHNIWTPHRAMEWGAPILTAFICYFIFGRG